ncbi:MAG: hydrogenase maturation protease [Hyphomicrobium sp.]
MIAVIGCGNPNRSDDGVGIDVIRTLRSSPLAARSDVRLLDAGTDGMAVMFAARGCRSLIIVDCCTTGVEPGAIYEVPGGEFQAPHQAAFSLHDFRWDHALVAGRKIFREDFPDDVIVLLIEGASLAFGIGLSPAVANASAKVAVRIEGLVADRLRLAEVTP